MLAFIACMIAVQVPIEQPPRLRTVLSNGAAILVEHVAPSKNISLELFVSSRGTETPQSNGLRHLLEHLEARGPKRDLDANIESAGGFISAETVRDATIYKVVVPHGRLDLGIKTIAQIMQMPSLTAQQISTEADIIMQEAALRSNASKLSAAAWAQAFGDAGLDVMGDSDVMHKATPEMMEKLHKAQFVGSNLTIAVAGDVDIDAATAACAGILGTVPTGKAPRQVRPAPQYGRVTTRASGEIVAVAAPGWRSPETAAKLAAAFALAAELGDSYVVYTPTAGVGLIQVALPDGGKSLSSVVNSGNKPGLFLLGRQLAQRWVARMLADPISITDSRGLLISQEVDLKPETVVENLETMSYAGFEKALSEFDSDRTVTVLGR